MSVQRDTTTGVVAGLIGCLAMTLARPLLERLSLRPGEDRESEWERLVRVKARDAGYRPSRATVRVTGLAAHFGYAAVLGALYGLMTRDRRAPVVPAGLVYGGLVYVTNYRSWGLLPLLDVLPPDTERARRLARIPIGTHTVFGVATAVAYRALRRTPIP